MARRKPKSCPVCGRAPCKGWSEDDSKHEYKDGNWTFGCHCPACEQARNQAGGFFGLIASLGQQPSHSEGVGDE